MGFFCGPNKAPMQPTGGEEVSVQLTWDQVEASENMLGFASSKPGDSQMGRTTHPAGCEEKFPHPFFHEAEYQSFKKGGKHQAAMIHKNQGF